MIQELTVINTDLAKEYHDQIMEFQGIVEDRLQVYHDGGCSKGDSGVGGMAQRNCTEGSGGVVAAQIRGTLQRYYDIH